MKIGTPLEVQGLRPHASNAGDTSLIHVQGTKIPHAAWPKKKTPNEKKVLEAQISQKHILKNLLIS